jgi:hypothetical protein
VVVQENHYTTEADHKLQLPLPAGLSLSDFAYVVLHGRRLSSYLIEHHGITVQHWSDYDGLPFEDFYDVHYGATEPYEHSDDPRIGVTFRGTTKDDFDYAAMAAWNTTTAYKRGRHLPAQETRFKVHQAVAHRKDGDALEWICGELPRLKIILENVERAMSSLETWAESGMRMQVYCETSLCRTHGNKAIIESGKLKELALRSLTLDDLREKLRCQKCGKRSKNLVPA